MPEYFIDGEPVMLSGPPPASPEAWVAFIEPILAQRGRVLARISVDGNSCDEQFSPAAWSSARKVEVVSLSLAEAVAQVAGAIEAAADALVVECEKIACEVVRHGWAEVVSSCVTLAGRLSELLRDSSGWAAASPPGSRALGVFAEALNRWMAGIESRNAAEVCLGLDRDVIPALAALAEAARDVKGCT